MIMRSWMRSGRLIVAALLCSYPCYFGLDGTVVALAVVLPSTPAPNPLVWNIGIAGLFWILNMRRR